MNRNAWLLCTVLMLSATEAATAATITEWNFNSTTPDANTATGTLLPAIGSGSASLLGGTTSTFASGDASGGSSDPAVGDDSGWNTTSYTAQGAGDRTRGVQFNVSTVGFTGIAIEWDQRHSNTSSRFIQFQYSTDGITFTDLGPLFQGNLGDTWFNNRAVDLTGVSGVANNADFAFRIVTAFAPGDSVYAAANGASSYSSAGTLRFDMVQVSGTVVPVPAALPLLLSALGLLGLRRRAALHT